MQRISSACCVAVQMLPAVHAGAAQLLAQLGMTYFMPFCLSALSMLARVQVDLLHVLLMLARRLHHCLDIDISIYSVVLVSVVHLPFRCLDKLHTLLSIWNANWYCTLLVAARVVLYQAV